MKAAVGRASTAPGSERPSEVAGPTLSAQASLLAAAAALCLAFGTAAGAAALRAPQTHRGSSNSWRYATAGVPLGALPQQKPKITSVVTGSLG